jgi:hypothetical protein
MAEEELIDFLNCCRLKNSEVMLLKALRVSFLNQRKGENGLLTIDTNFLLLKVISLLPKWYVSLLAYSSRQRALFWWTFDCQR